MSSFRLQHFRSGPGLWPTGQIVFGQRTTSDRGAWEFHQYIGIAGKMTENSTRVDVARRQFVDMEPDVDGVCAPDTGMSGIGMAQQLASTAQLRKPGPFSVPFAGVVSTIPLIILQQH
jgi:hypothetical protein